MFNVGVFMGWVHAVNNVQPVPWKMLWSLYIATCMWTFTYETVYQHQVRFETPKMSWNKNSSWNQIFLLGQERWHQYRFKFSCPSPRIFHKAYLCRNWSRLFLIIRLRRLDERSRCLLLPWSSLWRHHAFLEISKDERWCPQRLQGLLPKDRSHRSSYSCGFDYRCGDQELDWKLLKRKDFFVCVRPNAWCM